LGSAPIRLAHIAALAEQTKVIWFLILPIPVLVVYLQLHFRRLLTAELADLTVHLD